MKANKNRQKESVLGLTFEKLEKLNFKKIILQNIPRLFLGYDVRNRAIDNMIRKRFI